MMGMPPSFRGDQLLVVELNESQPNRGQGTRLVDAKHVEGREARDVLLGKTAA